MTVNGVEDKGCLFYDRRSESEKKDEQIGQKILRFLTTGHIYNAVPLAQNIQFPQTKLNVVSTILDTGLDLHISLNNLRFAASMLNGLENLNETQSQEHQTLNERLRVLLESVRANQNQTRLNNRRHRDNHRGRGL